MPTPDQLLAAIPAAIYAYCQQRGLTPEELHRDWGQSSAGYPDPDAFVPYSRALRLWDALIGTFPGEPVGLRFGAFLGGIDVGVVGLACAKQPTLGRVIETFIRFQRLVDPGLSIELTRGDGLACLRYGADPRLYHRRHPMEAMLASGHRSAERLAGRRLEARYVSVAHVPCASPGAYREMFGVAVVEGDEYLLHYDEALLDCVVPSSDSQLARYLESAAQQASSLNSGGSGSVKDALVEWMHEQLADLDPGLRLEARGGLLERAARAMGRSSRSLQRQLQAESTGFQRVLEEVLSARARHLLGVGHVPIFEVAFALGYSEPRAFQRAFKRWTGLTPSEYRAEAQVRARADRPAADFGGNGSPAGGE